MISEIDLQDYEQLPLRELYKCKPRSYVQVPAFDNEIIFFDHIDGMYSYCKDFLGNTIHLTAWLEVVPLQRKAPQSGQE